MLRSLNGCGAWCSRPASLLWDEVDDKITQLVRSGSKRSNQRWPGGQLHVTLTAAVRQGPSSVFERSPPASNLLQPLLSHLLTLTSNFSILPLALSPSNIAAALVSVPVRPFFLPASPSLLLIRRRLRQVDLNNHQIATKRTHLPSLLLMLHPSIELLCAPSEDHLSSPPHHNVSLPARPVHRRRRRGDMPSLHRAARPVGQELQTLPLRLSSMQYVSPLKCTKNFLTCNDSL